MGRTKPPVRDNSSTALLLSALSNPDGVDKDYCLRLIRDPETDLSARDSFGHSAIHLAAHCGHTSMIPHLVSAGADVNARSELGDTPIIIAVKRGFSATVNALIEQGADPLLPNDLGKNFFDYAPDRLPAEQVARIARLTTHKESAKRIDHLAHNGAEEERHTPPVPVLKKKPLTPGGPA